MRDFSRLIDRLHASSNRIKITKNVMAAFSKKKMALQLRKIL